MANVKMKLLCVLNFLFDTDEHHPLNATQIVEKLAKEYGITAERKSVCRDIAILQSFGHDIIGDRDKRKGWYYGKRHLEAWLIRILLDAVASSLCVSKTDFKRITKELIKELGPNDKRMFEDLLAYVAKTRQANNPKMKGVISEILRAISWERALEFQLYTYNKRFKNVLRRGSLVYKVDPYTMVCLNSHYYLIGVKEGETTLRYFRVDRIANPHTTGTPRRPAEEVLGCKLEEALAELMKSTFHGADTPHYEKVTLRFKDESFANVLVDQFGLPEAVSEYDGYIYATMPNIDLHAEVRNWFISYANLCTVVAPPDLRQRIQEGLKAGLEAYND